MTILGCIVGAVLIFVVVSVFPTVEDHPSTMEYDDYIEVEDAISSDGSVLEVVEIAGKTYVHAIDVGEGYYKLSDGREVECSVGKAKLDVVVAMGQSNNRYTCYDIPEASAIPDLGTSYYWGDEYTVVTNPNVTPVSMQELRDPDTGAVKLGDKVPVFCAHWTESTGHKIFYIVTAVGGSSITSWVPGELCYQRMIRTLNYATAAIDTDLFDYEFKCCTWIQGESDWNMELETYLAYFGQMHDGLFSEDYPYELNYMVLATPRVGTAVEADKLVADQYDNVYLATDIATTFTIANGLLGADGTHWTQEGDNIVAESMVQTALKQKDDSGWIMSLLVAMIAIVAVAGLIMAGRRNDG